MTDTTRPPIVDSRTLQSWMSERELLILDCRFDLAQPHAGRAAWLEGHIPGACYADLDQDLAAAVTDSTGRHPLPTPAAFADFLSRCGWMPGMTTVAYDAQSGAFAARLWWLMRFFGLEHVHVLDGGLQAWKDSGGDLQAGETVYDPSPPPALASQPAMVMNASAVATGLKAGTITLVDARDEARFRGEIEPIDSKAGHVPGALNRPFQNNLDQRGRFLPAAALREQWRRRIEDRPPEQVVHMCGSGVTACHNLLAMEQAGLAGSRLYVGSWSEWIRDPDRPVATAGDRSSPC